MLHEALVDDLVLLWSSPPPPGGAGLAAFRRLYADPVRLNGSTVAASDLLERARRLHDALADVRVEVLDRFAAPGRLAVVLRSSGRHVGPLPSPLGDVPPSGRRIEALGIDVLTVEDDRIAGIWVVADELGRLAQAGAVQLVG
jgi:predicted ester cyclase